MSGCIKAILLISICIVITNSCKSNNKITKGLKENSYTVIYDSIVRFNSGANNCSSDFVYFIPKDVNEKMPCIILFDPKGNGNYPVSLYKKLAGSMKCILVGSNQHRNGLTMEQMRPSTLCLIKNIKGLFPVETNKIVFAGFSGGGRVAFAEGSLFNEVTGIISCGAANLPNGQTLKKKYVIIAGKEDFNYPECVYTMLKFPVNRVVQFTSFGGTHEWPPVKNMKDGIKFCLNDIDSKTFIIS